MASKDRDYKLNPSVELIKIQRSKIRECENAILDEVADTRQSCTHINDLLYQLKLLYKMHFMYEEQLLSEVDVLSAEKQRHVHDMFLKSIDQLKSENDQCHTISYKYDINLLRLDYISIMNSETIMLCDYFNNSAR